MIKKISLALVVMILLASASFCAPVTDKKMSIGLDNPFVGFLQKNSSGQVDANLGISYGVGIAYKKYFEPLSTNKFNTYLSLGTVALIIPYIGVGGDYVWDNGFYLGAGIIYIIPEIHGGFMF